MTQIRLLGLLVLMGAGWGLSGVIAKPIVDAGYRPFGIILWQMVIGAIVLGTLTYARGKPLRFAPRHIALYLFIALTGTLLPNVASYTALLHLPAGIMSIIIASVSMFAFPIALLLGNERFEGKRVLGLLAGLIGFGVPVTAHNFIACSASHLVQWQMVQQGIGIGVMSQQVGDATPGMVRIAEWLEPFRYEAWLVSHRELNTSRRLRIVFDFLVNALLK